MIRAVVLAALALVLATPANAEEFVRSPDVVAEANGATTSGARGSSCTHGPTMGMCADTVWPPMGLGTPLPVTPGSTVLLHFERPVDLQHAQLGPHEPTFSAESPTLWRVTLPAELGDGLLSFGVLWQHGDWRGDQYYAVPLTTAAALVARRRASATVETRTAGTLRLSLVRHGRTLRTRRFAVNGPGKRNYGLRRARGARLVVRFTPPGGTPLTF
jgi:hypothetical protein